MARRLRSTVLRGLLLLCGVVIAGCGYRPLVATFPEGGGKIRIPIVENRTSYAGLGATLTNALRHRTSAAGIRVVTSKEAPSLRVTITRVDASGGMMARDGKETYFLDTIQTIGVAAEITGPGGRSLVSEKRFEQGGRSLSDVDVVTRQMLAESRRRRILDELSTQIVEYMFYRKR